MRRCSLVKGESGAALKVAETMGLRAALVAAGLLCAGFPAALLVRGTKWRGPRYRGRRARVGVHEQGQGWICGAPDCRRIRRV